MRPYLEAPIISLTSPHVFTSTLPLTILFSPSIPTLEIYSFLFIYQRTQDLKFSFGKSEGPLAIFELQIYILLSFLITELVSEKMYCTGPVLV